MVRSTSELSSAVWWMPRALLGGRSSEMYSSCNRARSASIAARSIGYMSLSDPEERVEELVGHGPIAPDGSRVHPSERGQDQASGIELDHGGQAGHVLLSVTQAVDGDVHQVVLSVAPGDADPDGIGVHVGRNFRGGLPQDEHERREQVGGVA